jgi:YD repeat-containing protein
MAMFPWSDHSMAQMSFGNSEYAAKKKRTRREIFPRRTGARERGLVSHCSITTTCTDGALDRPLGVTYPDPAENIAFTYDACLFGIGRLCTRVDASGSYAFAYDAYGNPIRQDYTTGASPTPWPGS